jgi:peptide chain release factor 2
LNRLGGIFDYPVKRERLEEVSRELESPNVWDDPQRAQDLGRERARLSEFVEGLDSIGHGLDDAGELLELSASEGDDASVAAVAPDVEGLEARVSTL